MNIEGLKADFFPKTLTTISDKSFLIKGASSRRRERDNPDFVRQSKLNNKHSYKQQLATGTVPTA